ncbi:34-kDa subunit of RNA polymerase III (C) [Exophiala xenobiotica]|uniref:34-kDa subunit of RNA polymerase III (C) n=1 Tax=Vermiconidia calcicola TaxID=1690605 RepID=A0AAV9Q2T5_9PEZI|nr:34-kDa subunit of RNA polymerase III (C) [Exophiala xenobiotica]KAK5534605.1 34-kDa subunit of RNA polymerase III (C) [Vermiconidia calcicola]KAK5544514.1 34-kDa subunit of RNA polymerase III (C) [Chaetothyriales sp. CCFEE 6169]KAK5266883.1 34-kDa subunit of RNA polymerase III (C) [Exophiala xenobiotica]KAK5299228.1 34-kDa subunit of RNA polymerase III (C) [Exophiala xenobiotica]
MAPPKATASPAPGPLGRGSRNRVADSLYDWCRNNRDLGHVFSQEELLDTDIIPNRDITVLLSSVQHLVASHLFKLHDRTGGTIGWELVDQEKAKNYKNLSRDEHMVLLVIDGAGSSGIWTKAIKYKSQLHARILERVYKQLEAKGLIKPMKHVKNPGRKMYILAGLEPSQDATGGAWFSDGQLDVGLLDIMSKVIEQHVAAESWQTVEPDEADPQPASPGQKRKAPTAGFEDGGEERAKAAKTDDVPKTKGTKQNTPKYEPFEIGYTGYPTARSVTNHLLVKKYTTTVLPQNAISQLLEVMVYDDLLVKMYRSANDDEFPDDYNNNTVTMYRSFKTPAELQAEHKLIRDKTSSHERTRKAAYRKEELEEIGQGGSSEVPCMRCPVFDICGDGGPVNVATCKYFDDWYSQIEEADREVRGGRSASRDKDKSAKQKDKSQGRDPVKVEIELDSLQQDEDEIS